MTDPINSHRSVNYCIHGFSHDLNELQNEHITSLITQITTKRGNHGWVLRRMSRTEICFMSDLISRYTEAEVQVAYRALDKELGGSTHRSREMIFARTVAAPVVVALLGFGPESEDHIVSRIRNILPIFGGDTPLVPKDCSDHDGFRRHVAWQRGALIAATVTSNLPHFDAEHLIWLGDNYEDIMPIMPLLLERRSTERGLVQSLMDGSKALSDGFL